MVTRKPDGTGSAPASWGSNGTARVDPAFDADVIHSWVSEERAVFWDMSGLIRDQVAGVYAHMAGLDTHHAHLVTKDDVPAALFQTYQPAADRVVECCGFWTGTGWWPTRTYATPGRSSASNAFLERTAL